MKKLLFLFLLLSSATFAQVKISALPASSALTGTEVAPVVQGGTTKKATIDQIKTYIAAGLGTVTSFSAGDLSPLFTTSEANPTTTPALTFSLTNAAAHKFFGNATGSTGAPSYSSIGIVDVTGLQDSLTAKAGLNGSWSLLGNSSTNSSTNFIGTTDNVGLVIKTNNNEIARYDSVTNYALHSTLYSFNDNTGVQNSFASALSSIAISDTNCSINRSAAFNFSIISNEDSNCTGNYIAAFNNSTISNQNKNCDITNGFVSNGGGLIFGSENCNLNYGASINTGIVISESYASDASNCFVHDGFSLFRDTACSAFLAFMVGESFNSQYDSAVITRYTTALNAGIISDNNTLCNIQHSVALNGGIVIQNQTGKSLNNATAIGGATVGNCSNCFTWGNGNATTGADSTFTVGGYLTVSGTITANKLRMCNSTDTAFIENVVACSPLNVTADSLKLSGKMVASSLRISGLSTPSGKTLQWDANGNASAVNANSFKPAVLDTLTDLLTGTITLTNNAVNIVVASATITATTIAFPTGTTNDEITIIFSKAVTTPTLSGIGTGFIALPTIALGGRLTFKNYQGRWY